MENVLIAIGRYPNGATHEQIQEALNPPVATAKLKYWLSMLQTSQRIRSEGAGAAVRYSVADVAPSAARATPDSNAPGAPADSVAGAPPQISAAAPAANLSSPGATPVESPAVADASTAPVGEAKSPSRRKGDSTSQAGATAPARASVSEAEYAALFEGCVYQIVVGAHTKVSTTAVLQQFAMQQFPALADRRGFVAYGKAQLEALTAADAEHFGIEPEQYEVWHGQYFGRPKASAPAAPSEAKPSLPAPAHHRAAASIGSLQPTAADVAALVEPLQLGELKTSSLATLKALVTRKRAGIAAVWGAAVVLGAQRLLIISATHVKTAAAAQTFATWASVLGYLCFPAAGLPWLLFRWQDRRKASETLTGADIAATLIAGGILTYIVGRLVAGVISALGSLLP